MGCCLKMNVNEVMTTDGAQDSGEESDASSLNFLPLNTQVPVVAKYWDPHRSSPAFPEDLEVNSSCSAMSKLKEPHCSETFILDELGIPKPVINSQSSISDLGNITMSTIRSHWSAQHTGRSTVCSEKSTLRSQSLPETPITEVTSQLYLGSYEDAKNEKKLLSRAISHTICLIGPKHEVAGIQQKHYPMSDFGKTDLKYLINNIWTFVEESQQPGKALFVHCMFGQNRSATIVIAILMKLHGHSLEGAFKIVKNKRPIVQINEQYAKQLSKMEEDLHGRKSVSNNWMEIKIANMSTGSVCFFGESMMNMDCKYEQLLAGKSSSKVTNVERLRVQKH